MVIDSSTTRSNDGNAGALFHAEICDWDGNVLLDGEKHQNYNMEMRTAK